MEDLVIQEAQAQDIAAILDIERASFPVPWTRAGFERELNRPESVFWVAKSQGRIVGYAVAWDMLDHVYLANIAVEPRFRGKGIARALLRRLVALCRETGRDWLVLDVRVSNKTAMGFYQAMGFVRLRRNPRFYGNEDGYTYALNTREAK